MGREGGRKRKEYGRRELKDKVRERKRKNKGRKEGVGREHPRMLTSEGLCRVPNPFIEGCEIWWLVQAHSAA